MLKPNFAKTAPNLLQVPIILFVLLTLCDRNKVQCFSPVPGPSTLSSEAHNAPNANTSNSTIPADSQRVQTFGGYRISHKKRVQRDSMEDKAPSKMVRKITKKKKQGHGAEAAALEKKRAKIDEHCGLGYEWDADEKLCVTIIPWKSDE